jgi:hypothetical protein
MKIGLSRMLFWFIPVRRYCCGRPISLDDRTGCCQTGPHSEQSGLQVRVQPRSQVDQQMANTCFCIL